MDSIKTPVVTSLRECRLLTDEDHAELSRLAGELYQHEADPRKLARLAAIRRILQRMGPAIEPACDCTEDNGDNPACPMHGERERTP